MDKLVSQDYNGIPVVDSRDVAEMVEREHNALLKTIRSYCEYLGEGEIAQSDFFIESSYINSQNKEMPCYLITKKGCDMIANKMTGAKGVLFTAAYVTAFEKMREQMAAPPALPAPVDTMATANEAAKILAPIFDRAGMSASFQALAMKQIYRKAGIELPVESLKAERTLYDIGTLAKQAGVFSLSGKPHVQAVGCILRKLEIPDSEKELVSFEKNGHMGTTYQYTANVAELVKGWVKAQGFPEVIASDDGTRQYKVNYEG